MDLIGKGVRLIMKSRFGVRLMHKVFRSINAPQLKNLFIDHYKFNFFSDGMATIHNFNFAYDERFLEAYERSGARDIEEDELGLGFRLYNYCYAAAQASFLEGDYVECGVHKGMCSKAITHYIGFEKLNKKLYLLDTFEGLIENQLKDGELFWQYPDTYSEVKEAFKQYSNVELVKGIIPDTLPLVKADKICYLALDLNCAYPEIKALEYFWDKIVSGGIIILDDYAYRGFEAQMKAIDEFAKNRNVKVLNLNCGQGLIIKP
ncbi:MAG: TylF/MycF family methyltransferase [Lachnospiraceae bacterium]|nr:TylF/MycF family methyltransferase [Lachnospiraceae bacterium]